MPPLARLRRALHRIPPGLKEFLGSFAIVIIGFTFVTAFVSLSSRINMGICQLMFHSQAFLMNYIGNKAEKITCPSTPTVTYMEAVVPVTVTVVAYDTLAPISSPLIDSTTTITLAKFASTSTSTENSAEEVQFIEPRGLIVPGDDSGFHKPYPHEPHKPLPHDKDAKPVSWVPYTVSIVVFLCLFVWLGPAIAAAIHDRHERSWRSTLRWELFRVCDADRQNAPLQWVGQTCRIVWNWIKAKCDAILFSNWCKGSDGTPSSTQQLPQGRGSERQE